MSALQQSDRVRLVKLLSMLGSDHADERDAAGLAASRFLKQRGLSWEDALNPQLVAIQGGASCATWWRGMVGHCVERAAQLTAWERQFLESISARRSLSPKQTAILGRIHDKVTECGR